MISKNKDFFSDFFKETEIEFNFLETDYGYNLISKTIENQKDVREKSLSVRYLSYRMSIEVSWHLPSAIIDTYIIENINNNEFPQRKKFWGNSRLDARAISLYTYLLFLGKRDILLLENIQSVSRSDIAKRIKIIEDNLSGVIKNLANALREHAVPIILGDTPNFSKVQKLELEIQKKRNPQWKYW